MQPPVGMSAFEFVVLSSLRAAQLTRGCTPRIEGVHKKTVMAQMEVAERKVVRGADLVVPVSVV
jgi:DNA-directed RNA polymerase subunit K/omega